MKTTLIRLAATTTVTIWKFLSLLMISRKKKIVPGAHHKATTISAQPLIVADCVIFLLGFDDGPVTQLFIPIVWTFCILAENCCLLVRKNTIGPNSLRSAMKGIYVGGPVLRRTRVWPAIDCEFLMLGVLGSSWLADVLDELIPAVTTNY